MELDAAWLPMRWKAGRDRATFRPGVLLGLILGALALCLPDVVARAQEEAASNPAADPETPSEEPGGDLRQRERIGRLMRVRLPITGDTLAPVRRFAQRALDEARTRGARPVLVFEFDVLPDQTEFARTSQFGAARDLAYFLSGEELSGATTVAFLPHSIEGHAVLAALACDQIVMAADAEIGEAGVNERTITPDVHSAYREIARRRKSIPEAMAIGLVDKQKKVLEVETDISREYVLQEDLEELSKRRTIRSSRVMFEAGQPGRLSGEEARELDFVAFMAADRRELARALELRPEAIEEDPSLGRAWKAVRVDFKGPVNGTLVDQAQRMIEDAVRRDDVNFVCLWIHSPGGSPADSIQLATFLCYDLDPSKVRTVAYVKTEARSDAALVALACDQVVIQEGAVLGGPGGHAFSAEEIAVARQTVREVIAARKSRTWSLPSAMIDPELEVFRYRHARPGALQHHEYFCEEELAEQRNPQDWRREERVTQPGKPFQTTAREAKQFWLADHVVEDFFGFRQQYGLENDPALLEPNWVDFLVDVLASPHVAWLLVIIGGAALYAELNIPGIGLGGFVAAVCFLLFFWSRFLGGTAGWLEVTLFVAGVSCLLLEVFVLPGFGIFGLGGGLLVIVSLVLASQTFVVPHNEYQFAQLQRSLVMLAGAAVGIIAAAMLMNRWLPKTPGLGQMVLSPPAGEEAAGISRRETFVDYGDLLGERGTTLTSLVPAGKARFGDRRVDVTSDGEFIPRGISVVVAEVHGNRVVVRPADEIT